MTSFTLLLCWLLFGLLASINGFSPSSLRRVTHRSAPPLVMQQQQASSSSSSSSCSSAINEEGSARRRLQRLALSGLLALGLGLPATSSPVLADQQQTISRADVGFLNLQQEEPRVTDICWMDLQVGPSAPLQRIEISLYGDVVPRTVQNFKQLCSNAPGFGYRGSSIFRVLSELSVQGGNIGQPANTPPSQLSRYGRAAIANEEAQEEVQGFPQENLRILHDHPSAGVVSMMKNIKTGLQDSRFFITLAPSASWADGKYVAFGRVTKGMDAVQALQIVPVQTPSNHPLSPITIADSGLLPPPPPQQSR